MKPLPKNRLKSLLLGAVPSALRGKLRAWRNRWAVRTFPQRIVAHNYGAGTLKVLLVDPLSEGWYDVDWAELPEIAALRNSLLRPGARVFDLGAHQGVVAMMLAREVGERGLIVAVEANSHNAAAARRNCELNGMKQVEVVACAVSDKVGTLVLNEALNSQIDDKTGSNGRQTVECVTLDYLASKFGMPDLCFLDIEGAEAMALAGAARVLSSPAAFCIEVHVNCGLERLGSGVEQVIGYFPSERYSLSVRAECDKTFRPLYNDDSVLKDRFFLLAIPREANAL